MLDLEVLRIATKEIAYLERLSALIGNVQKSYKSEWLWTISKIGMALLQMKVLIMI